MFDNSHIVNEAVVSADAHPQQGLFVANLAKCDKPLMASSRLDSESSQHVSAQPSKFPVRCDGTLLLCCAVPPRLCVTWRLMPPGNNTHLRKDARLRGVCGKLLAVEAGCSLKHQFELQKQQSELLVG